MSLSKSETDETNSPQQPKAHNEGGVSRRRVLQAVGGAAVTIGASSQIVPQASPVGRAEAVAPVVAAGAAAAAGGTAGAGVGWAVREYEIVGSDDPPEGLTPEALQEQSHQTARTRQSNNQSTFFDNKNILDGVDHAAYGDGKLGAIEALNEQESESEVLDAALGEVNEYATTIKKNFLKSWNESVHEYVGMCNTIQEHPDLDLHDDILDSTNGEVVRTNGNFRDDPEIEVTAETEEIELPDGSDFELERLTVRAKWDDDWEEGWYHPFDGSTYVDRDGYEGIYEYSHDTYDFQAPMYGPEGEHDDLEDMVSYLRQEDWKEIWESLEGTFDGVRDGLTLWVSDIYGDVQAGDLDTEDLLTPREMAEMSAEEDGVAQAIADLQALNIPTDLEREAHVEIERGTEEIELHGSLSYTQGDTLESGETYDPDDLDGSIYLTYDVLQGSGEWLAYDDDAGVDGGTVTFTAEPHDETLYRIKTSHDEEATANAGDFEPDDEDDPEEWTVDVSDQLETSITDIETVEMYAESDEDADAQYETIQLQESFTIQKFTDSDGEEVDSADFTQSEPQSDDNYIEEDEWAEMQERNEELIEKYEDAQSDPLFDPDEVAGFVPDDFGTRSIVAYALGVIALLAAGAAAVSAFISSLHPLK